MSSPTPNPLSSAEAMKGLVARLERCSQIANLSDESHNEASTLAHSLSDLADASDQYLKVLPSLLDESLQGDELIQRLVDVVNVLQHMLYHLEDPRFFRQFLGPLRDGWEKARTAAP
jgi:hypothetical protein